MGFFGGWGRVPKQSAKQWLKSFNKIIKMCFSKVRIKKNKLKPDLESLFDERDQIISNISMLRNQSNSDLDKIAVLHDNLEATEKAIGDRGEK